MLFPKLAVDREYSFYLFTEKKSAKDFDDIVLRYEQDGKIVHRFIQIKHRKDRNKKISIGELLTRGKDGAFGLIKYLISYLRIKSNGGFEGEIEDFVIVTNADFDSSDLTSYPVRKLRIVLSGKNKGKGISVIMVDTQDEFLDIGNGARYKFDNSVISYLQENKDFIKHEVGREVSDKEIEDFLNKLVFAVNLPGGAELREIIRSELGKEFSNADAKHFCSRYQEEVLILLEKEEEEFLSYEQAKALFEGIREEILGAIWFNVKDPVRLFTGREMELGMLHNTIQRDPKGAVISHITSIVGLGGVGKTELARKYACKYKKDYDDNVIWIDAERHETMKESFLELANRLSIPPKNKYGKRKTIGEIVKEVYAFFAKRKSLFIFDNAEKNGNLNKFLPYSLSSDLNKPYILITSHDQEWEKGIDVIVLKELEVEDAVRFVKKGLNIPERDTLQDQEIKNLVKKLQCFPLVLQQAISYIEDQRIEEEFEISDYLKEYGRKTKKLLKSKVFQGIDNNYTKTTFTTLEITMDKVRSNKQYGQLASEILDTLTYFAPDKIAREIFLNSVSGYKKGQLKLAIRLLVRYSMVSGEQKQSILNIHRLVQDVTRLKLRDEGREEEVLRRALELINSDDIAKENIIHTTSIWEYASEYSKLIDGFFLDPIFIYEHYSKYNFGLRRKDTNLHLLAENGNYETIKTILRHVKKAHYNKLNDVINAKDQYDITPLHLAAGNGELNIVKYLINKGAYVDTRDEHYKTPLFYAAESGKLDIVKYLVKKGADVNARDRYDWTPLYWAAEYGSLDVVEYFIEERNVNISAKDKRGETPIHLAAANGKLSVVKYFIEKGIDINMKGRYGETPLHWATGSGKLNVVKYLVSKGAYINAKSESGGTPLHWAVGSKNLKVIKHLVESGSDVNAKDKPCWTPLHWATNNGELEIIKYLVSKGASLDAKGEDDETPLHYAAHDGSLKIIKHFIEKGANVNAKDKDGNTPLHLTAMVGKVDAAKVLLKHNADVNIKNNEGITALHYATNSNHKELVELLLSHNTNPIFEST